MKVIKKRCWKCKGDGTEKSEGRMTKEQFDQKFQELVNQVPALLKERAEYLFKSGAIELGQWEDNHLLPRVVISSCLTELARVRFGPLTPKTKKEVRNLLKF